MTITEKEFTKAGTTTYYHYFEYNGIPNYKDVDLNTWEDWTTLGGNRKVIQEQEYTKCIPKNPELQDNDGCTDVSGIVGITITGTPLWTWHTSSNTDAVAEETMDHCGGHPNDDGKYHFHGVSLIRVLLWYVFRRAVFGAGMGRDDGHNCDAIFRSICFL